MNRRHARELTALTDQDNVGMVEVPDGEDPVVKNYERAASVLGVDPGTTHAAYKGKSLRVNRQAGRRCDSATCPVDNSYIHYAEQYLRVVRGDDALEMFHVDCFRDEFGEGLGDVGGKGSGS